MMPDYSYIVICFSVSIFRPLYAVGSYVKIFLLHRPFFPWFLTVKILMEDVVFLEVLWLVSEIRRASEFRVS